MRVLSFLQKIGALSVSKKEIDDYILYKGLKEIQSLELLDETPVAIKADFVKLYSTFARDFQDKLHQLETGLETLHESNKDTRDKVDQIEIQLRSLNESNKKILAVVDDLRHRLPSPVTATRRDLIIDKRNLTWQLLKFVDPFSEFAHAVSIKLGKREDEKEVY